MLTAPHEFAHAWVATRLGDDTPLRDGRVTLNPLAHVDWIGTALLPFVTSLMGGGFLGWGRPVSTNPAKLRGGLNGLALVALAGPVSNIVMAVLLAAVAIATVHGAPGLSGFAQRGVLLSIYLALFNLLPVPPLDGSKLLLAARIPIVHLPGTGARRLPGAGGADGCHAAGKTICTCGRCWRPRRFSARWPPCCNHAIPHCDSVLSRDSCHVSPTAQDGDKPGTPAAPLR